MLINIIGGSGFVGTRLSKLFNADGMDFIIIDKVVSWEFPEQTFVADVRSVDKLSSAIQFDAVLINLAAEHRDDVKPLQLYDDVNVQGARNICHVAKSKNVKKIIFTSSVAVYGFAPLGTNESGKIAPFNRYGQTKYEAECVFKEWQSEDPLNRTLIIIRPTVIFGEQNRGNVYNLLRQISSGKFIMVGNGLNKKSMAYVGNVVEFIKYSLSFKPGVHVFNYIDKPDFTMNQLVTWVNKQLGKPENVRVRLPYYLGLFIGKGFDLVSNILGRKFAISAIRVKKFCANSVYESALENTGFEPPISFPEAIERTIRYEFIDDHSSKQVFFTE